MAEFEPASTPSYFSSRPPDLEGFGAPSGGAYLPENSGSVGPVRNYDYALQGEKFNWSGSGSAKIFVSVPSTAVEGPYTNLISGDRSIHILYGEEGATSGGHLWPGLPNKTPFPECWSAPKVLHEVSDIVTDPAVNFIRPDGKTGFLYNSGQPARFIGYGVRDGVRIKVVYEPAGEGVITAHPQP